MFLSLLFDQDTVLNGLAYPTFQVFWPPEVFFVYSYWDESNEDGPE